MTTINELRATSVVRRLKISNPGDDRFKSWQKAVTHVDTTKTNGYAFEGEFLTEGREYDLPAGTVIIYVYNSGSRAHHYMYASAYVVTPPGDEYEERALRGPRGGTEWSYNGSFLTFRDVVARAVNDGNIEVA